MPKSAVALVTGAGRGIGRAIALRLAKDGYNVALNDIRQHDGLEGVKREIREMGRDAIECIADVSKEAEVKVMVDTAARELGGLDVMVANAGICVPGPFMQSSLEDWDHSFNVNGKGLFLCYKYAAQRMIEQGRGGRIIGACSQAGKQGDVEARSTDHLLCNQVCGKVAYSECSVPLSIYQALYCSRESSENLPGVINTDMAEKLREDLKSFVDEPSAFLDIHGTGRPEHIAALVSYLASKEASFVTGQSININNASGVAIVTGSSRGIGRAIALQLADDGYHVALNDLPSAEADLLGLKKQILDSGGGCIISLADVTQEKEVVNMVDEVVEKFGGIDVMVANAGICIPKPFLECDTRHLSTSSPWLTSEMFTSATLDEWEAMFNVNGKGVYLCYKYAGKQMIKQGKGGRIIGACSVAGKQAAELGKYGITMQVDQFAQEAKQWGITDAIYDNAGKPEDVAGLVSYLVSPAAKHLNVRVNQPLLPHIYPTIEAERDRLVEVLTRKSLNDFYVPTYISLPTASSILACHFLPLELLFYKPSTSPHVPGSIMATTIEINDAYFCSHFKEVCGDCNYDGREDNDAFYGFDPIDREPIEPPTVSQTKDGVYQCKKHGQTTCNQCFGWKKQINKLRGAAKKAGKS
ncbi:hypothetical protein NP233_g2191 [Leucocoprinus birnbaumii]|uniref:3-oxoacyl-[acyl-carrier-protein] reductase n=1 Tax=Leucocoprinus birnbaumii TaxID=56174 RepID=A0AAD5YZ80_9AGAR|nr:hypothetical protein NP233_g2191 [Leucocoprinus birnbaumii]